MKMKKDFLSHKKAVNYVLNNNLDISSLSLFENDYINDLYRKLVIETKNSYNVIKNNSSIEKINNTLDKKRLLSKEFKVLTNIDWSL